MTLPEFIKRYHNSLPNDLANLFEEEVGDDQDLTHPNTYFMVLFHQMLLLKEEVKNLKQFIRSNVTMD